MWALAFVFYKFKACFSCMIPLFFTMGAQGGVPLSLSACFIETGGFTFKITDLGGKCFYDCDQLLVGGGELSVVCNQLLKN